jgi:hypothetical protein
VNEQKEADYLVVWTHIFGDDCPLDHVLVYITEDAAHNAVKNTVEGRVVMYRATVIGELVAE